MTDGYIHMNTIFALLLLGGASLLVNLALSPERETVKKKRASGPKTGGKAPGKELGKLSPGKGEIDYRAEVRKMFLQDPETLGNAIKKSLKTE